MFPEINCFKEFLRKNIIKMIYFFTVITKLEKKDEDYVQVAYKENVSSCATS